MTDITHLKISEETEREIRLAQMAHRLAVERGSTLDEERADRNIARDQMYRRHVIWCNVVNTVQMIAVITLVAVVVMKL